MKPRPNKILAASGVEKRGVYLQEYREWVKLPDGRMVYGQWRAWWMDKQDPWSRLRALEKRCARAVLYGDPL